LAGFQVSISGRFWVSTEDRRRRRHVSPPLVDGPVVCDGLALDVDERFVYVAESSAFRVTRFPIRADGSLGAREQYGPDLGTAPDGIAFDEAANLPRRSDSLWRHGNSTARDGWRLGGLGRCLLGGLLLGCRSRRRNHAAPL